MTDTRVASQPTWWHPNPGPHTSHSEATKGHVKGFIFQLCQHARVNCKYGRVSYFSDFWTGERGLSGIKTACKVEQLDFLFLECLLAFTGEVSFHQTPARLHVLTLLILLILFPLCIIMCSLVFAFKSQWSHFNIDGGQFSTRHGPRPSNWYILK